MAKIVKILIPEGASQDEILKLVREKLKELPTDAKYRVDEVLIQCEDKKPKS